MEVPYSSPISISRYPDLSKLFLFLGFVATSFFFVYQAQIKKTGVSAIVIEILIGLVASICLGMGTFFGMMAFDLFM